jgi:stage II sporulation protein M
MKKINLKAQYTEAIKYIRASVTSILIITTIFITSIIIGFFNSSNLLFLEDALKEILDQTINLNSVELTFFILQNNLQTSFFGFLSGFFLGIVPVITTLMNGLVIGFVIERASQYISLGEIIANLLPHGIFELPAVILSLSLGLKFPGFLFAKNKFKELKNRFYNSMNIFLLIIVPLLIIAASIEGVLIAYI